MDKQHRACLDLAVGWSSFGHPEARAALRAVQESWAALFESFDAQKADIPSSVTEAATEEKTVHVIIPKEWFLAAFDAFMKGFLLTSVLDAQLMNDFSTFCSNFHTILDSTSDRLLGLASQLHRKLSHCSSATKHAKELYAFWGFIDSYPFYLNSAYQYAVPMTVMFFVTEHASTFLESYLTEIVIAALTSFIKMNLKNINHPAVSALAIVLRRHCDTVKVERVPWMSNFPAGASSSKGFFIGCEQACHDMDSLHRPVHKLLSAWISIISETNDTFAPPLHVPSALLSVVVGHNQRSTARYGGLLCELLPHFSTMLGGPLCDLFIKKVTCTIPTDESVHTEQNTTVHPSLSKKRLNEGCDKTPFKRECYKDVPTSPFASPISLLGRRTNSSTKERQGTEHNEIQKAIERNFSASFFLNNNIEDMLRKIEPGEHILYRNKEILLQLQSLVSAFWPNAKCELCGSVAMELDIISSNLDLSIRFGPSTKQKGENILDTLLRELIHNDSWENTIISKKQSIHVLSTIHKKSKTSVDIIRYVPFVHIHIAIIKTLIQLNPLLRDFVRVIKFWAAVNGMRSSSMGTPNGIAFVLMAVFHFQSRPTPALPRIPAKYIDYAQLELATDQMREFRNRNNESIGELLISFFELFGSKFDYDRSCISIHEGQPLQRPTKHIQDQEDLSNPEYNVTKLVTRDDLARFIRGCQLALLKLSSQGKLVD